MMTRCMITAEIGCNHNGSEELARKMVDAAARCGVDAVKFQTFHSDLFISRYAPKAPYQKRTKGEEDSQLEMTKALELPEDSYIRLRDYAVSLGLKAFSTPFDEKAVDFLAGLSQRIWKIPSGEITNRPLLERIRDAVPADGEILLSTGMAEPEEIEGALKILELRDEDALEGDGEHAPKIALLHCHTAYPTRDEDMNLLAIRDLKARFPGYDIGLSDHSTGCVGPVAAVAFGIRYLEKHFTLNRDLPGPDHQASVTPEELARICEEVRRAETMMGDGRKHRTESEAENLNIARKSIVAAGEIRRGESFSEENLACKRPGGGISPMLWNEVIGRKAERDFAPDEFIEIEGLADGQTGGAS